MAGKSAILSVRVLVDAAKAKAGFKEAEDATSGFQSKMDKLGDFTAKAAAGAAVAGGAYAAFAKTTIDAASEMEQAAGAVEAVFQGQSEQVMRLADGAAQAVGLASSEYANMAALMGSQLKNMGIEQDAVAGKTDELIRLGADLAAQYGGSTADAVSALSSLLRGERDPIERYAVGIKQADINARLAAEGLTGLEGEAAKQAETQATLALLFEQSESALGAFGREAETLAGQQQRATAEWENAKAKLGEQLLPYMATAAEVAGQMAAAIGEHPQLFRDAGIAIGVLAGALITANGAITAVRTATQLASAAQVVFNAVLTANPIGLAVTALAALAAGLIYAYKNSESFREAVHAAGQWAVNAFQGIVEWVQSAYNWISDLIRAVGNLISYFQDAFSWGNAVSSARDLIFGSAHDDILTTSLAHDAILTFTTAAPEVTAAAAISPQPLRNSRPSTVQTPVVINVTVSDSVVGDERLLATTVRRALENLDFERGLSNA